VTADLQGREHGIAYPRHREVTSRDTGLETALPEDCPRIEEFGDFADFRDILDTCRAGAANTEPDTDHSVLYERKRGSHHYLRSGESLQSPLQSALCACL
jgi:hypothetical protein